MRIKAAVIYKPYAPYVIGDVELDGPKAGEVLVKVVACGYCHSDHYVSVGKFNTPHPVVLGHEGSGIVAKVGEGVKSFKPGDRVCMSYSYCGECFACLTGRPYQCESSWRLNFGGRAPDGTTRLTKEGLELSTFFNQSSFATYSVTHQNSLVHVPDDIDLRLAGPLGCGVQTGAGAILNVLKPEAGSSIVIVGLGGVGMSGLMAAKACGCATIIGVDMIDSRLELATELGATHVINARNTDVPDAVKKITNGVYADYGFDATGIAETKPATQRCTHAFGSLAFIGPAGPLGLIEARNITGITQGRSIPAIFIPKLIELHLQGLFPFDKLIRFYDFEDINEAAADSAAGKTIKPVLVMRG